MHHTPSQDSQATEMSLRDPLLASSGSNVSGHAQPYPPPPNTQSGPEHPYQTSDSSSHEHLDPAVASQQMQYAMSGDSAGDEGLSPDARKGKRELSTSKRAAQNRAAQRAFRQRKEGYIKKLEEQVKEFQNMEQQFRAMQNENYQLREYILSLQSRLLESSSDVPPAPFNLTSAATSMSNHQHQHQPEGDGSNNTTEAQLRQELQQHAASSSAPAVTAPTADMSHDPALRAQHGSDGPVDGLSHPQANHSPYGLGSDYAGKRSGDAIAADAKSS